MRVNKEPDVPEKEKETKRVNQETGGSFKAVDKRESTLVGFEGKERRGGGE